MTGKGWVDGSDIRSRPTTKEYRDNYDCIFRKRKEKIERDWEAYADKCEAKRKPINGN